MRWTCLDLNLTHLLVFGAGIPFEQCVLSLPVAITCGVSFLTFEIGKSCRIVLSRCGQQCMIFLIVFFSPLPA